MDVGGCLIGVNIARRSGDAKGLNLGVLQGKSESESAIDARVRDY
jgi:hypothetical protein